MSTEFTNCGCGCPEGAQLVTIEENEDRSYLYDVGGEQKETVPFTKELRQWQQSFINIGGRALNTLADIRSLTKHIAGQVMICFENNGVYQYQNITIDDDGETILMPDNVFVENAGRWVLRVKLDTTSFNLWSTLKYGTALSEDRTIYVDYINGIDSDNEDGTINNPFKTIQYAIDTYVVAHGYWKGVLTIKLKEDYTPSLSIVGLIGNGSLIIESDSATVRNVSFGYYLTLTNNQIKIFLNTLLTTGTVISLCDISLTNTELGDGIVTNSKLNIGTGCVFTADPDNCDIKTIHAQINSTINHSNLIAQDIQAGSAITISNSIIASDSYEYIAVGANCNHNRVSTLNTTDKTFYVANITGVDSASTIGDITHPFKTVEYAISRYLDGNDSIDGALTIELKENHIEPNTIEHLKGSGGIIVTGAYSCSINFEKSFIDVELKNFTGGNILLSGIRYAFLKLINTNGTIEIYGSNNVKIDDTVNTVNEIVMSNNSECLIVDHTGNLIINNCNVSIQTLTGDVTANYSSVRQAGITGTVTNNHSLISA